MKPTQPPSSTDIGNSSTRSSNSSFKKLVLLMVARAMIVFLAGLAAVIYAVHRHPQTVQRPQQQPPAVSASPAVPVRPAPPANGLITDLKFPKNFFFGSAYSDFQTAGISETSDWYDYVNGFKPPQVGPGIGNDLFHRYKEDFDAAHDIGIQVHRISLEWSRIEPQEGVWDRQALKQYAEIFRYMKKKGVEPMICLNHFPLPQWFTDNGGWEKPE